MAKFYRPVSVTITLLAAIAIAACSPKNVKVEDYSIITDLSGLKLVEAELPSVVYKRPGAPTLAAYDRFIIDPVQVIYDDPEMEDLDPEDVAKMQRYFQDAIIKELREAGYEVGTRSQPGTLRISFITSGYEASSAGGAANVAVMATGAATGVPLVFSINVGEVRVEAVFREAVSNRIDGVVVSQSRGSRVFKAEPWSTWADVEGTFDQWAEGIRKAIDEAHERI